MGARVCREEVEYLEDLHPASCARKSRTTPPAPSICSPICGRWATASPNAQSAARRMRRTLGGRGTRRGCARRRIQRNQALNRLSRAFGRASDRYKATRELRRGLCSSLHPKIAPTLFVVVQKARRRRDSTNRITALQESRASTAKPNPAMFAAQFGSPVLPSPPSPCPVCQQVIHQRRFSIARSRPCESQACPSHTPGRMSRGVHRAGSLRGLRTGTKPAFSLIGQRWTKEDEAARLNAQH